MYSLLIIKHGPTWQQGLYPGTEEVRFKQVSVARRCHPVTCQHVLQTDCQPGVFYGVLRNGNHGMSIWERREGGP
jgi:hypothetical protein